MINSNPIATGITILTTDWVMLAHAFKSVPVTARNQCNKLATLHALEHHEADDLYAFWLALGDSFL